MTRSLRILEHCIKKESEGVAQIFIHSNDDDPGILTSDSAEAYLLGT